MESLVGVYNLYICIFIWKVIPFSIEHLTTIVILMFLNNQAIVYNLQQNVVNLFFNFPKFC